MRRVFVIALAPALLAQTTASANPEPPAAPPVARPAPHTGCLPNGDGYLKARIRGALTLNVDLAGAELECEGGARSDGSGLRLSFVSVKRHHGHRIRMVFGLGLVQEGRDARNVPTNLTVILEGEQRLYGTRGESQCTVDRMTQQRLPEAANVPRTYRVVARGLCVGPAASLDGRERIVVSEFDFAGAARFSDSQQNQQRPVIISPSQPK